MKQKTIEHTKKKPVKLYFSTRHLTLKTQDKHNINHSLNVVLKMCVLTCDLNVDGSVRSQVCLGRRFQSVGAAMKKALSPGVLLGPEWWRRQEVGIREAEADDYGGLCG